MPYAICAERKVPDTGRHQVWIRVAAELGRWALARARDRLRPALRSEAPWLAVRGNPGSRHLARSLEGQCVGTACLPPGPRPRRWCSNLCNTGPPFRPRRSSCFNDAHVATVPGTTAAHSAAAIFSPAPASHVGPAIVLYQVRPQSPQPGSDGTRSSGQGEGWAVTAPIHMDRHRGPNLSVLSRRPACVYGATFFAVRQWRRIQESSRMIARRSPPPCGADGLRWSRRGQHAPGLRRTQHTSGHPPPRQGHRHRKLKALHSMTRPCSFPPLPRDFGLPPLEAMPAARP